LYNSQGVYPKCDNPRLQSIIRGKSDEIGRESA
jgi:hypothetical protein